MLKLVGEPQIKSYSHEPNSPPKAQVYHFTSYTQLSAISVVVDTVGRMAVRRSHQSVKADGLGGK